jgi:pimeloyl-ACP methyl ester carboxylesterase
MERTSRPVGTFAGWDAAALERIAAPTLLLYGDADFVRLDHVAEMLEHIPSCRLGILPATTHVAVLRRADRVVPMIEDFLAAPA